MKNKDTVLLAEAYDIAYMKNILLEQGYTLDQINEVDWSKLGKTARNIGAAAALGAAGLTGAQAANTNVQQTTPPPTAAQTSQYVANASQNTNAKANTHVTDAEVNQIMSNISKETQNIYLTAGYQAVDAYVKAVNGGNPSIFTQSQDRILNSLAAKMKCSKDEVPARLQNIFNNNPTQYKDLTFLIRSAPELSLFSGRKAQPAPAAAVNP
jgi:hypothetical protein